MDIKLCRDLALVNSWCLRVRTQRTEWFAWHEGWKIRFWRGRRDDDTGVYG